MTETATGGASSRRSRLVGVKLRALVRDHLADDSVGEPEAFEPGAVVMHGGAAWVLLDDRPASRLGAALAWAVRGGADALHVIAEEGTGVLARRAASFAFPISVWHAEGRLLLPAVVEPLVSPPAVPAHHLEFRDRIVEGGADPVEEHGVLVGEVRGLEVCRVVDDSYSGATRLEVGLGAHDREAFAMMHGDVPTIESLSRVVQAVLEHRQVDASPHPLNRIAAERLLRWRVIDEPEAVGAATLAVSQPPVPRPNLKDPTPCVATGDDAAGDRLVVVCSTGVELDLVPFAADARLAHEVSDGRAARLVIVTPARDRLPITDEIAGLLRDPVRFATVD